MPQKTTIEWTRSDEGAPGYTSNPIRARDRITGKVGWSCVKVSPGCAHCYSETINDRFGTHLDYNAAGAKRAELFLSEVELKGLLKLKGPARVFLGDMTDVFQGGVPNEWIDRIFAVMAVRPDLTFQVLTKRADELEMCLNDPSRRVRVHFQVEALRPVMDTIRRDWGLVSPISNELRHDYGGRWPLPNLWLGVSCEDQARADERIPHLLRTPAAVRFLSVEPLLGPVDFGHVFNNEPVFAEPECVSCGAALAWNRSRYGVPLPCRTPGCCGGMFRIRARLHWVIVGGESGKGARPCDLEWIRSVIRQCEEAGVPAFVKQLGANLRHYDERCWRCGHADWGCFDRRPGDEPPFKNCNVCGADSTRCRDAKGGDINEFPEDLKTRQFPSPRAEVTTPC